MAQISSQHRSINNDKSDGPQSLDVATEFRKYFREISQPLIDRHTEYFPDDDQVQLIERARIGTLFAILNSQEGVSNRFIAEVVSCAIWSRTDEPITIDLKEMFQGGKEAVRSTIRSLKPINLENVTSKLDEPYSLVFVEYFRNGLDAVEVSNLVGEEEDSVQRQLLTISQIIGSNGTLSDLEKLIVPTKQRHSSSGDSFKKVTKPDDINEREEKEDGSLGEDFSKPIKTPRPRRSQTVFDEISDFKKALNHRLLSREEEMELLMSHHNNRENWLRCLYESPLVQERALAVYSELSLALGNGEDSIEIVGSDEVADLNVNLWKRDSTQSYHDMGNNLARSVEAIKADVLECKVQRGQNNFTAEKEGSSPTTKAAIALVADKMAQFPLSFERLSRFFDELRAYDRELQADSLDSDDLSELLVDVGESAPELHERLLNLEKFQSDWFSARDTLASHNQKLVFSIAKRWVGRGVSLNDLFQSGNLGLLRGIELMDPTRGFKLSTYATWWIKQEVSRTIQDQGRTIRIPVHIQDSLARIQKEAIHEGDSFNDTQLAERAGNTNSLARFLRNGRIKVVSFDAPISAQDSDSESLIDGYSDPRAKQPYEGLYDEEVFDKIIIILEETLDERQRDILLTRYGLGDNYGHEVTLEEVGIEYSVTRERIRQIEAKAIRRLQQALTSRKDFRELLQRNLGLTDQDMEDQVDGMLRAMIWEV